MKTLKYFLQCYFNQSFGFGDLDRRILDFKEETKSIREDLISELYNIIQTKKYAFVSRFIKKYANKTFDQKKTEKFINYLYDRLLDNPTTVRATDFKKKYKAIFCPVCTQDPKLVDLPKIIYKATIKAKNIEIYICKLCQLIWLDADDIQINNGQNYKEFMKANGLKGWWQELKDVDFL